MLYVFEQDERLLAILSNDNPLSCPYFEAPHTEKLNGENTFDFSVPFSHEDASFIVEENLIAFKDQDQNVQLFVIRQVEEVHDGDKVKIAFCESAAIELLDEVITDQRPSNVSAGIALTNVLLNTRWQVGTVDDLGLNSDSFYYESALSAVHKIATTWGGELRFRVVLSGNTITGRYVDILTRRGTDTGKRFEYTKDITSIKRKVDSSGIKTALYGRGKGEQTEDGFGRRITFDDAVWSTGSGDPVDKPAGQEWVADPVALVNYGRPDGAGGKRHRVGVFEDSEETDPAILLQKTWDTLQSQREPLIQYEMKVIDLESVAGFEHEKVRLGDTVRVIDREFVPPLAVVARVIEVKRYRDKPEKAEVKIGNFLSTLYDETSKIKSLESKISFKQGIWEAAGGDPNAPVATSRLEGIIDTLQNGINAGTGTVTLTDDQGILILDDATTPMKALRLLGGQLAISNEKDAQDQWIWRTFGNGDGFTADQINAGKILTNLVQIFGNTNFYWDGDYFFMVDPGNTNKQIRVSKDGIYFTTTGGSSWNVALNHDGLAIGANANYAAGYDPTVLRNDLNLTAPLPTALQLDGNGITASVDANNYARLDYRGLYIKGGGIQIEGGLSDSQIQNASTWNAKETTAGAQSKVDAHGSLESPHNLPSYCKMQSDGFKVFDALNNLRCHMGQYAAGKYGVQINDGAIYSTSIRTTTSGGSNTYIELATNGNLNVVGPTGKQVLNISAGASQGKLVIYDESQADPYAYGGSIMLNGATTKDLWIHTNMDNGINLSADTGESITMGPCSGVTADRGVYISGLRADLKPYTSDGANLGSSSRRWWLVKCYTLSQGDSAFEETSCAICGQPFQPGEVLGMLVKGHHEEMGTMTIPVHVGCQGKKTTIELQMPEVESYFEMDDTGVIREHKRTKFISEDKPVTVVSKQYKLDEKTGSFKKKAVVVKVAKEGHVAKNTGHGVKYFNEQTGEEVNLEAITEEVEVAPERNATKEEAIVQEIQNRRTPVMKTITVKVDNPS